MPLLQLRNGKLTNDPRLDRIYRPDPRSANFPVRLLLEPTLSPRSYTWSVGLHQHNQLYLDQGQEGACVGFSFSHELAAKPVIVPNITNETARSLYWDIQRNDQWDGGSYPGALPYYEGTSVLDGARYITNMLNGYKSYAWAKAAWELAVYVSHKGPAVLGINWYTGMMDVDSNGYLNVKGNVEGGHAILCKGYNVKRQAFTVHNSWGQSWGIQTGKWMRGEAFIRYNDMTRLLAEDGEACMPLRKPYQEMVVA